MTGQSGGCDGRAICWDDERKACTRGWRLANEAAVLFRWCRHIPRLVFSDCAKVGAATLLMLVRVRAGGVSWLSGCVSVAFTPYSDRQYDTLHCLVDKGANIVRPVGAILSENMETKNLNH